MTKHLIALEVTSIGKSLQLRILSSRYVTILSFASCISNNFHSELYQDLQVTLKMWVLDSSHNELILVETVPHMFHQLQILNFYHIKLQCSNSL